MPLEGKNWQNVCLNCCTLGIFYCLYSIVNGKKWLMVSLSPVLNVLISNRSVSGITIAFWSTYTGPEASRAVPNLQLTLRHWSLLVKGAKSQDRWANLSSVFASKLNSVFLQQTKRVNYSRHHWGHLVNRNVGQVFLQQSFPWCGFAAEVNSVTAKETCLCKHG